METVQFQRTIEKKVLTGSMRQKLPQFQSIYFQPFLSQDSPLLLLFFSFGKEFIEFLFPFL